jgi:hypothetical protein
VHEVRALTSGIFTVLGLPPLLVPYMNLMLTCRGFRGVRESTFQIIDRTRPPLAFARIAS